MDTKQLILSIRNDLARAYKGECGEDVCAEVEYVIATSPAGQRWAHPESFEVVSVGYDEFPFAYPNKKQIKAVNWLLNFLQRAQIVGLLDLEDWTEIEPMYGSESWDSEAEYRLGQFEHDAYTGGF